ncbi:MAG: glutamine-hydrolyzing carbamoyl-phosphate synthase small subunit [Promethearchaeota archaeon]
MKVKYTPRNAALVLANGRVFEGYGFGATKKVSGEVVFNTATAAGYNCALTDPSNQGQIYAMTYPLIGNYGVPPWEKDEHGITRWFESESIKCTGFVVHEACKVPHHYESTKTLHEFLLEQGVPGIEDVDTRALTRVLRDEGLQLGVLEVCPEGETPDVEALLEEAKKVQDPNERHLVREVSTSQTITYNPGGRLTVVLVDCGVKNNILRSLVLRDFKVVRVPFDATLDEVVSHQPDGVVISNGPGNPELCVETVELARGLLEAGLPLFGICLGNQVLGLAIGCEIRKLKYGHRGGNKPVIDETTGRCHITTQNHSFVVDEEGIEKGGFKVLFRNADDKSVEGMYHPRKEVFSVQFHPEAYPGPLDTGFLFDRFKKLVERRT